MLSVRNVLIAALLFAVPVDVRAQSSNSVVADEHTGRAFEEGLQAFDDGRYEEAWVSFKKAHALSPTPFITYNLALSGSRTQRYVEAGRLLEQVLPCSATCPAKLASDVRKLLDQVSEHTGRIEIANVTKGTRVDIDDDTLPEWALRKPWHVNPGTHKVTVYTNGNPTARTVTVQAGQSVAVGTDAASPSTGTTERGAPSSADRKSGPTPSDNGAPSAKTVTVIVGASFTLAALTSAIVTSVSAEGLRDNAREMRRDIGSQPDACTVPSPDCEDLWSAMDSARRRQTLSNRLFVASGVLAAATAGLYLFWPENDNETKGSTKRNRATVAATHRRIVPEVRADRVGIVIVGDF